MKKIALWFYVLTPLFIACTDRKAIENELDAADPGSESQKSESVMTQMNNDVKWLTNNSPFIFIGSVTEQKTDVDKNGLIYTTSNFEINKVVKGNEGEKAVTVKTLGGEYKGETMTVSHMPIFYKGERYLIFMDPKKETYSPVTGNEAGVFIVHNDSIYTYGGQSVRSIEDNKLIIGNKTIEMRRKKEISEKKVTRIDEAPISSTPDLKIESLDVEKMIVSEPILSVGEFTRLIQSQLK